MREHFLPRIQVKVYTFPKPNYTPPQFEISSPNEKKVQN